MKKWFILLLTAGMLSGCGNTSTETVDSAKLSETVLETEAPETEAPETEAAETETPESDDLEVVKTAISEIPDGMTLYKTLPFSYQDEEWKVELYAMAEMDEHGELMLDDSCRFYMRAVSGDGEYLLFDEQVQLGIPSAEVFTDEAETLHIVVKDVRTALYRITDYVYEKDTGSFGSMKGLNYEAINFMGEIGTIQ